MIKISFLGDIICQLPFLQAAQSRNNDFFTAFSNLNNLLEGSDFVVANLETPIAGEAAGYTNALYSFNTPAAFLDALKNIKIDLYTTANNHILDRGVEGLRNTAEELKKRQMDFTGTSTQRSYTKQIQDTTITFLSYTGYVNEDKWEQYGQKLAANELNLLIDMDKYISYRASLRAKSIPFYRLRKFIGNFIPNILQRKIKDSVGIKVKATIDNEPLEEVKGRFLDQVREDIAQARKTSDIVFLLPHCGGQFNITPGTLSKEIFTQLFSFGADAVIGNHAHTIQKAGIKNNRPYAFSLGNVSNSPSYPFLVKESLPDYGMVFHIYIEDKAIAKTTFSIIKSTEEPDHYPIVKPIDELYATSDKDTKAIIEKDVNTICQRIFESADTDFGVRREYEINRKN